MVIVVIGNRAISQGEHQEGQTLLDGAVEMKPTWQGDVKLGTLVAPGPLALDVLACSQASLSGAAG